MGKFLSSILSGSLLSFLVAVVLVALVWLGGEYLKWPTDLRILLTIGVLAVWLVLFAVTRILAIRRARRIEDQLREQAAVEVSASPEETRAQVTELQRQFWSSLNSLKSSKVGKGALYSAPWYVVIGAPGSGKSSALIESELNFPSLGQGPRGVRGVGGTRNCDWWFTEEGIFLDTAGRYTTEPDDRAEWQAFLGLLRKVRRARPINGAIVAVSAPDLVRMSGMEVEAAAQTVRERLDELTRHLDVVFPTYVVFTKFDLVKGFREFFESLDRTGRSQVWGCTLPFRTDPEGSLAALVEQQAQPLYAGLCAFRVKALAAEQSEEKRRDVYLFPLRFAVSLKPVRDFLVHLFRPNPFQESAVLRGFYFTSAVQQGTPMDPLEPQASEAAPAEPAAAGSEGERRPFFLHNLFSKIVLPDRNFVRVAAKVTRRKTLWAAVSRVASLGLLAGLGTALVVSFLGNRNLVGETQTACNSLLEAEKSGEVSGAVELSALDTLLNQLEVFRAYERNVPWKLTFGLYRGQRIAGSARTLYFRRLQKRLVIPAAARVEAEMQVLLDKPKKSLAEYDRLYRLYQAYLMATGTLAPKPLVLKEVLGDGGRWFAGLEAPDGSRPQHLDGMARRQLDFWTREIAASKEARAPARSELVEAVRKELAEALWMTETYRDLVNVARDDFPPIDRSFLYQGAHADVFTLETLFSTIYTQNGWNEYIRNSIEDRSESLARKYADLGIEKEPAQIAVRLRQDFVTDYLRRWNGLLETTRLRPATSLQDAADLLRDLSGPESPIPGYLDSIRRNQVLRLSATEAANEPAGDLKWVPDALKVLAELHAALDVFVRSTRPGRRIIPGLRQQKLAPLVQGFQECRGKLQKVCLAVPPGDRAAVLTFVGQPIDRAREALAREAQDEVEGQWSSVVAEMFEREFKGRYPFAPAAAEEVSPSAFSRMMNAKNGVLWEVAGVVENLRNTFIDGQPLVSTSGEYDRAIRDAETVRDAFYPPGENAFAVKFWVTVKQFAGVRDIRFRLAERAFSLYDRPDRRGAFTWSEADTGGARVAICVGMNQWVEHECPGPWGLLRLIRGGDPRPVGAGGMFECKWSLEANVLGRIETFQVGVLFEPAQASDLFKETFFERFRIPPKVGP